MKNELSAFFTQHTNPSDQAAALLLQKAELRCVGEEKLLLMSGWVIIK